MNIFILNECPELAARDYCNKHLPKMIVECYQMLGSSVIRHGATPDMMPLTKKGTPLKGGYHNHPCSRWVGDSRDNYIWTVRHALEICKEYTNKYNKIHFCEAGIRHLNFMAKLIPEGDLTHFALAMPDEYRPNHIPLSTGKAGQQQKGDSHADGEAAVAAYRRYYHSKEFARWDDRTVPTWWRYDIEGNII
tara:strand:- start:699 stop:1274 length:576 start_codon:yes stop_codon:yes gene_type:complete